MYAFYLFSIFILTSIRTFKVMNLINLAIRLLYRNFAQKLSTICIYQN
jgi:hypothetical protein